MTFICIRFLIAFRTLSVRDTSTYVASLERKEQGCAVNGSLTVGDGKLVLQHSPLVNQQGCNNIAAHPPINNRIESGNFLPNNLTTSSIDKF